eukprot:Lankesteria_metandrocarpae@DN2760_c0_g2_i1.p1
MEFSFCPLLQPLTTPRPIKILTQILFYFSDSNLHRDVYLQRLLKTSENGWIHITELCGFGRLNEIGTTEEDIVSAFEACVPGDAGSNEEGTSLPLRLTNKVVTTLEIDSKKSSLRLLQPQMAIQDARSLSASRSIFIDHLPVHLDHMIIARLCAQFGDILHVSLPRHSSPGRTFKGFGFVEFDSQACAHKACNALNGSDIDTFMIDSIINTTGTGNNSDDMCAGSVSGTTGARVGDVNDYASAAEQRTRVTTGVDGRISNRTKRHNRCSIRAMPYSQWLEESKRRKLIAKGHFRQHCTSKTDNVHDVCTGGIADGTDTAIILDANRSSSTTTAPSTHDMDSSTEPREAATTNSSDHTASVHAIDKDSNNSSGCTAQGQHAAPTSIEVIGNRSDPTHHCTTTDDSCRSSTCTGSDNSIRSTNQGTARSTGAKVITSRYNGCICKLSCLVAPLSRLAVANFVKHYVVPEYIDYKPWTNPYAIVRFNSPADCELFFNDCTAAERQPMMLGVAVPTVHALSDGEVQEYLSVL